MKYNDIKVKESDEYFFVKYKEWGEDDKNVKKEFFSTKEESITFINELDPYKYCVVDFYKKTVFEIDYGNEN